MTIAELIHGLRTGSVKEKCRAATELGNRANAATEAVGALLDALQDPGQEMERNYEADGWGRGWDQWLYVQEAAIRALFRVSPQHMPQARKVMISLRGWPSRQDAAIVSLDDENVEFSDEMWEAAGGKP